MEEEYFQFYEGDKMGIKTLDDTVIVPAQYNFVAPFSGGFFMVQKNNTYSYFNTKGNLLFPFESTYETYSDFSEGLAAVYDGEHYGFINETGKEVISPQFIFAENFSDGYAVVRNDTDLHGVINTNGELVIEYIYKFIGSFENGYAKFGDFTTWGLIDVHGKEIVPQIYAFLGAIEDGKIVVQMVEDDGFAKEGLLTLGGEVAWNNNLDDHNQRIRNQREFTKASEALITEFYADGCPCERPRFRDYIQCEGNIRKVDQELLWTVFKEKLETEDSISFKCPICSTNYETDYQEFNAFFGVQQIHISTSGYVAEKGSEVTKMIPFVMGFQAFELDGRIDNYVEATTEKVMAYLKA